MLNKNLNQNDKEQIRKNLLNFMEANPIKEKKIFGVLPNLQLNYKAMPLFLALLLLLGSGTTAFAAEGSLPGETLYPIKNITEHVRGWAKIGQEAKAEWQSSLAEKRLEELEKLYEEGKINEETKNKIEEKIQEHLTRADEHMQKMQEKGLVPGAFRIASRLEFSFKNHEQIMGQATSTFSKWEEKLEEKTEKLEEKRQKLEEKLLNQNDSKTEDAANGKLGALENKINGVENYFIAIKQTAPSGSIEKAEEKLQEAKDLLEEGKEKMEDGLYGEAFVLFCKGHMVAQEAKMLSRFVEYNDDGDDVTTRLSKFKKFFKGKKNIIDDEDDADADETEDEEDEE